MANVEFTFFESKYVVPEFFVIESGDDSVFPSKSIIIFVTELPLGNNKLEQMWSEHDKPL